MSNLVDKRAYKSVILLVDLALIYVSYIVAFHLRYDDIPQRNWDSFIAVSPWILIISLFFLSIYEMYSLSRKTVWEIIGGIFVAMTFITFITMSASFLFRYFALPRTVIVLSYGISVLLLILWKIIFLKINTQSKSGRVLLISSNADKEKFVFQMEHPLFRNTRISAVDPEKEYDKVLPSVENPKYDFILISSGIRENLKSQIIYHAMKHNKVIYVVPSLYDLLLAKSIITSIDDTMVMAVKPFGLTFDEKIIKRVFDIIVAFFLLVITLPTFLFVALMVKLEDPRSRVIYSQSRLGENNREFVLYKFRSMIEDAEKDSGPVLAEKNDKRITRVGQFIRATRLDELPQLLNVLKGDMSLVGPRPEREHFIKILSEQHKSYHYRNTVKPGLTGYAQIMGSYSTDVEDKLRFDLYYIRNYSLWLDIVIILRTIVVLLDRTKSEGKQKKTEVPSRKLSV
ncbi:sugar transferase [Paenibacillus naphthalenovorans]|uniref:sugar transferase n=1 Tax=Paenibacillus naphthalenovorans TaxID=162209 RepID=UPI003D2E381F